MKSLNKTLHLIAFDIPYPPNYGGAIDIFFKIKALCENGVRIILHCFQYGNRKPSEELEKYCMEVNYYPRLKLSGKFFTGVPYIISSRQSNLLLKRLLADDYPIFFEGLHTCYYLNHKLLKNRKKIVRTHNVEHDYYYYLAKGEKNWFRKLYFIGESYLLKTFEKNLQFADLIVCISPNDCDYFSKTYGKSFLISAFHPYDNVNITEGKGEYALYHGSLEVNENSIAAQFLVEKVFNDIDYPLIIAGNNPQPSLVRAIKKARNVELRTNVTINEIHQLVRKAQINILPTFQPTGIKLKLLLALFIGRHCVVNQQMVENTGLENLCHIGKNADELKNLVMKLKDVEFNNQMIAHRKEILHKDFSNEVNAKKLIHKIFE